MSAHLLSKPTEEQRRFARFSWGLLVYVLFVILWGAFVRVSGSGAGCGSHWPLCNGEVLPADPGHKTLIELTHRITSGLSGFAVLWQVIWSRRLFERGSVTRRWAAIGGVVMLIEVAIGAGIVLFEYVDQNASVGRALWMAIHLCNTFLLLGALTLTAHVSMGGKAPKWRLSNLKALLGLVSVVGMMFVGASGAVAALGDTLFPPESLHSALATDLSMTGHFLVRLRVVHPFAAIGVAFFVLFYRMMVAGPSAPRVVQRWGTRVRVGVLIQLAIGLLNVMLLAPAWMQLLHLLMADLVWIALVLLLAHALGEEGPEVTYAETRPVADADEPDPAAT